MTAMSSDETHLTGDVSWIGECFPLDGRHRHVSVYLTRHDGRYVVVDSGSFYHREAILDALERATDGEGIDALILSHSDYPHSANVSAFREAWGDFELVASSGSPEIQGLPEATRCEIGGSLSVRGRRYDFIDPPLADRSHTTWIYDRADGVLYTADGFGAHHRPGECAWVSSAFDDGISEERIRAYHETALAWLRYVDPEKVRGAIESIFAEYDVRYVAPIHGNPIAGADVDRYLDRLYRSIERISDAYDVPE